MVREKFGVMRENKEEMCCRQGDTDYYAKWKEEEGPRAGGYLGLFYPRYSGVPD